MENHELTAEVQKLSKEIEAQRGVISHVVGVLVNLSNAVNKGFEEVNERLSKLEGKEGMKGVNSQLADIKQELSKIQKAYPYDDMFDNLKTIQGQA